MNKLQKALSVIGFGAVTAFYGCTQDNYNNANISNTLSQDNTSPTIEQAISDSSDMILAPPVSETSYGLNSYAQKLHNADNILVSEVVFSLGKKYEIFVNDELVATVQGKNWNWWNDKFVLQTVDGKVLEAEEETKRVFAFNRSASFSNAKGNITGYIAEDIGRDFLKFNHIFHIYNSKQEEVGITSKTYFTILDEINLYDTQGNIDYQVNQRMTLFKDKYDLKIMDKNSLIPVEKVILLACIEDAIKDAKQAESSSSDD